MKIKTEKDLKQYLPNKRDIKNISSFFYAFSDFTRLKIIIILTLQSLCVTEIASVLEINQTTVSHQLKILKSLNIVDSERLGKNIVYFLKNKNIEEVLNVSVDCI